MKSDPPEELSGLTRKIDSAKTPEELANIGAGELENLLAADDAANYVAYVLEMARKDKNWRFTLGCVWMNGFKDKGVAEKVRAAIKLYFPDGTP